MRHAAPVEAPEIASDVRRTGVRDAAANPAPKRRSDRGNAPADSAAAARLLDRDLPPGHIDESTRHFAAPAAVVAAGTQSAFVFRIGADWLALPAGVVDEVAEPRAVHIVPHRSGILLGLVNVRGELLVCVSLARLLGIKHDDRTERRRLLVLLSDGRRLVCPVDEAHGGCRYAAQDLSPPPVTIAGAVFTHAMLTLGSRAAGLLDERLIAQALKRGLA